jgi:GAF domain-containing protein
MFVRHICWNRIGPTSSWPRLSDSAVKVLALFVWDYTKVSQAWSRTKSRPVAVEHAKNHPRFKYFSEAGEDAYQSFLGIPLIDRGALVVQTIEARTVQEDEIRMLADAAAQVAPVVSEARPPTVSLFLPRSRIIESGPPCNTPIL